MPRSKLEFRLELFRAHMEDLQDVTGEEIERFICPICLRTFTRQDVEDGNVTDGHVWPEYLRTKDHSAQASKHRVLLCARCNSEAGAKGDVQAQILERLNDTAGTDPRYGERRVEVFTSVLSVPIALNARVEDPKNLTSRLVFALDKKKGQWARNNPDIREQVQKLFMNGGQVDLVVYPPRNLDAKLAQIGWLTSGYLLAFYTFGYRYIFNNALDPVRDAILSSFERDNARQGIPDSTEIGVEKYEESLCTSPRISLAIPCSGLVPVHLQVDYLNYRVSLPFRGSREMLQSILGKHAPALPIGEQPADYFYTRPANCTKTKPHECLWDYLLGKPFPE